MISSLSLHRLLSLALACTLCSLPLTAQAARSYQVDLIIFTLQAAEGANSEQWLDNPPPLDQTNMSRAVSPLELMANEESATNTDQDPSAPPASKQEKDINFNDVVARINKDPRRKVVLTASWVQPVQDPNTSAVIHLSDRPGETEADLKTRGTPAPYSRPVGISGMPVAQNELMLQQPPLIDGFAHFYLSGYYTMELDLRYTPEVAFLDMENPDDPKYTSYRIHEKRRMKSDELNYYDHPKFGVLLLVNPAAVTESAESASQP